MRASKNVIGTTHALEEVETIVRAAGVKVTRGRVRVLDLLRSASQPLSHVEIEASLNEGDDATMDRVTVYRILDSLIESGLALKAVDTRGVFRYSSTGAQRQHRHHIHFRCLKCARVYCLDVPPPAPPELPKGFKLVDVNFDVSGTCESCSVAPSAK